MQVTSSHQALQYFVWAISYEKFDDINVATADGQAQALDHLMQLLHCCERDAIQGEVMGVQLSLRVLGDGIICLLGGFLLLFSSKLILLMAAILAFGSLIYFKFRPPTPQIL